MYKDKGLIVIENTRMVYRNFSGRPGQYNKEGDMNFAILLDEADAKALSEEGFNVRYFKQRDPEEVPQAFLRLIVRFDRIPPEIHLKTSRGDSVLTQETVGILDTVRVDHVDVSFHPRLNRSGQYKYTGYLRELYVTVAESYLERKYQDDRNLIVGYDLGEEVGILD